MPIILAPIGIVVVGLFALLLLFGALLFVDWINNSLSTIPVVPVVTDVFKLFARGLSIAFSWLVGTFESIARGAVSFFTSAAHAVSTLGSTIEVALWKHLGLLRSIILQAIPSLARTIADTARSILSFLGAQIAQAFGAAIAFTNAIRNYLLGVISTTAATLLAYTNNIAHLLQALVSSAFSAANAYSLALHANALAVIGNAYNALSGLITLTTRATQAYALALAQWAMNTAYGAAVDWARRYSDVSLARAKAATDALAIGVGAAAWPYALPAIDAISLALPASVAAVLDRIGALPRALTADVGAIAGVGVAVGTIALDWVRECGLDLCRNTKGFGDELASLADAALLAAIVAYVAEAVTDPEGAAHLTDQYLAEPISSLALETLHLINLAA